MAIIESAQPVELNEIVALLSAQLAEHDMPVLEERLLDVVQMVLADSREGFILVAREDDRLVGLAYAAAHLSAEHGGTIGWLEELYVVPERRGRGVGSQLLEATLTRACELDWRGLELEVVAGHERAAALYERHGFAALARQRYVRSFTPEGTASSDGSAEVKI